MHSGWRGAEARWYGPWMSDADPHGPGPRARLLFPVLFSLVVQVSGVLVTFSSHRPQLVTTAPSQLALPLALAIIGPLALLAARRFPGPVVAFIAVLAAINLFVNPHEAASPPYVALAFAIVGAIVRGARWWAWISVAGCSSLSLVVALVLHVHWDPPRIVATTLGVLIVMGIGESARSRRDAFIELARIRRERRQSEVQAERVRIARELHDVLAHSLSQINVQASVGLHLMDAQPEQARDALASIKEASKTALDEVRSVLGVLREGGQDAAPRVPEPDLSRIDALAASVSTRGVAVTVTGSLAGVPQATQLAIYRIVQESLTNILRHARATKAEVLLDEEGGTYVIQVTDNGHGGKDGRDTEGRGLLGMRERAELLGGTLEAVPLNGGGFQVTARIPVRERRAES